VAASVFHSGAIAIPELKRYLRGQRSRCGMSIEVRPSLDALQALDWGKGDGLLPAVVQDADTCRC
jgi:hypothetical protein